MASDLVAIENRLWAAADKRFTDAATQPHAKGIRANEREPMIYQV